MEKPLLSAKNIRKTFDGKADVLCEISLDLYREDFTVIMGSSGSGKSTLLYALSGMDGVSAGQIFYQGRDITNGSERDMASLRAKDFGFVFQKTHLVSNLTLYENIVLAGYVSGKATKEQVRERTNELLLRMNLMEAKDRLPASVSGGEAQRAAVARAVISKPQIVFADEPTGALNRSNSTEVLDLFSALYGEGQAVLMVTHDKEAALRGNRILYLEDGWVTSELKLPGYQGKDAVREGRLTSWLATLGW
ncbi:ABC transporter ATP-binding protein [Enterocloster aldenensis]|uniref:ABC transporter ATP-binding protein n=1 Tax=Enterocloster aldenensis TaxID=358742 RepID=UPI000E472D88|nr:ABC transporter ATP-binding protein [Enterocloster aldenensis]